MANTNEEDKIIELYFVGFFEDPISDIELNEGETKQSC